MTRAGKLTERITLVREQVNPDSFDARGQLLSVPLEVATIWAQVRPLSGDETIVHRKQESGATHEVTIRYSSDVSSVGAEWWIYWGSTDRRLDIEQATDTENRHQEIVILAAEKTS